MTILTHGMTPSPGQMWQAYVYPPADFSLLEIIPGRPGVQIVVTSYHVSPQVTPTAIFWGSFALYDGSGTRYINFDGGGGPNSLDVGFDIIHSSEAAETRLVLAAGEGLFCALNATNGTYPDSGPFLQLTGYFQPVRQPVQ